MNKDGRQKLQGPRQCRYCSDAVIAVSTKILRLLTPSAQELDVTGRICIYTDIEKSHLSFPLTTSYFLPPFLTVGEGKLAVY